MSEAQHESAVATIGKSQGVVYVLPHTAESIPEFLEPAFGRVDPESAAVQALVLTDNPESAVAIAEAAHRTNGATGIELLPATSAGRSARLLKSRPVRALSGTPEEVLALVTSSSLKLDDLKVVVISWLDDVLAQGGAQVSALEALLSDAGKDADRIIVVRKTSPQIEEFIERYARRARRIAASDDAFAAAGSYSAVRFVTTATIAKPATLRRVLDELDPPSAAIVVRSAASETDARQVLTTLGYTDPAQNISVSVGPPAAAVHTIVFYDAPVRRIELANAAGAQPVNVIALVEPAQVGTLRDLLGSAATPFGLGGAAQKLKKRDDALRNEVRSVLSSGIPPREIAALYPLLEEYDSVEIAAAALQLLERERRINKSQAAAGAPPAEAASRGALPGGPSAKLFITIGGKDGIKPGDLLATIAGESGITGDRIGKIDMFDAHTIVEVPAAESARIIAALNGKMIRGRKVAVRADRPKSERADRGDRGERPTRPGFERGRPERSRSGPPRGRSGGSAKR